MTAAALGALLAQLLGSPCPSDAEGVVPEAESLLDEAGPAADPAVLARARDLYRRARLERVTTFGLLRGAELAGSAGDEDEAAALLEEASREAPDLLGPWERLLLARRAEARGARRLAILQYGHVVAELQRGGPVPAWIGERIRRLDVEEEARLLPLRALPPPSAEAQRVFAEAQDRLRLQRVDEARSGFRKALRLAPGYVEAALALGGLEARSGRAPEASAAYRTALAADPESSDAALSLSNLLWAEPDRQAKEESLALLDRAIALRPDLVRLRRESAERWAAWGDAARALERLDAYRAGAAAGERAATDELRQRLVARLARPEELPEETLPDLTSPALEPYRLARVFSARGDPASLERALLSLAEAQRLDPGFAPAYDLESSVAERRGEGRRAEAALRKALEIDPARASRYERLATMLTLRGEPAAAFETWRLAERAGSREALIHLARAAAAAGHPAEAAVLYRRYAEEAPDGPHAAEARAALDARRQLERVTKEAAGLGAALAAGGLAIVWVRRRTGVTLAGWLNADPDAARELRPLTGRLRHEALKHGGLLVREAAERLSGDDAAAAREAVGLLLERLDVPGRGLAAEARRSIREMTDLATRRGFRLNARHKDPVLSVVLAGLRELEKARLEMSRFVGGSDPPARRRKALLERLRKAGRALEPARGRELGRILDDAESTGVSLDSLKETLERAAREAGGGLPPALQPIGEIAPLRVRMAPADWETVWRNLFSNALAAARGVTGGFRPSLGLAAERVDDPVTGESTARIVLFDDVPRRLTAEMLRGRAAERGLGVVADLVRRSGGFVDVVPPRSAGYQKGVAVELPAVEVEG